MSVFEKMKFPPYSFREYPKMIRTSEGKEIIVQTQREELAFAALGGTKYEEDPVVAEKNRLAAEVAIKDQALAEMQAQMAEMREMMKSLGGVKAAPPTVPIGPTAAEMGIPVPPPESVLNDGILDAAEAKAIAAKLTRK
jgi:hypothetical protein